MAKELAKQDDSVDVNLVKRTVAVGATDDELKLFLYDCQRRGVHPLDKLLHFTKRQGKYTPIVSIDLMRSRAAETGEMAGSDDAVFDMAANGKPTSATVTVYRLTHHIRYPYTATARMAEYYVNGMTWNRMPHVMLAKCAEALALRKAFPQQLAGLYTREEMDQAGVEDGSDQGTQLRTVTGGKVDYPSAREHLDKAMNAPAGEFGKHPIDREREIENHHAPTGPATPAPDPQGQIRDETLEQTLEGPDGTEAWWRVRSESEIENTCMVAAHQGWMELKRTWESMPGDMLEKWRPALERRWKPTARKVEQEKREASGGDIR